MSYVEFKGTLCSTAFTGGSKSFYIQPSPTGYYAYTVIITTYQCSFVTCQGGFQYTIHVDIRNASTGEYVTSLTWKAPFNPGQKTTISFSGELNLEPNTPYVMTWWVDKVDFAGGCFNWLGLAYCILCADIDMILWQVPTSPSPPASPSPTASPAPPMPIPSPSIPSTAWTWLLIGLVAGLAASLAVAIAKQSR